MIPPPQTPGMNLALFADETCLYATDHKEKDPTWARLFGGLV
jgi:hypothetical protein